MALSDLLKTQYSVDVASIDPISSGRINRNYKVTSQNGNQYCLKVYSPTVPDNRLFDGLRVAQYLAPLGFPVPVPVATVKGEHILRANDTRYLVLWFLPGRNLLPTQVGQRESLGMGTMLGNLHHSLRFFPEADQLHRGLWSDSAHSTVRAYELLNLVQNKPQHDSFDLFTLHSLTHRIQIMQGTEVGPAQFSHLCRQALHGDYHLSNVVFDDDGLVSGVLDFDQTCYGFPAWELMRAIGFTCFQEGALDYSSAEGILLGYLEARSDLSPSDYLEMPRLWYYQLVRGLWGLREHYEGEADPRQDEAAYGRHQILVWLGEHLPEVRRFIWSIIAPYAKQQS